MYAIKVKMKTTGTPLKRLPVVVQKDGKDRQQFTYYTDRFGCIEFGEPMGTGHVYVAGRSHYQGSLERDIVIELWSMTGGSDGSGVGAPAGIGGGSIAYPSMQTDSVMVNGIKVETCSEGYIVHPEQWSEEFSLALAEKEGLELTEDHWQVIRYLREYYSKHHVQCTVRDMIKHFRTQWGKDRGNNRYLHQIFPQGGPQKQGNRLAGLLRTKGEH